MLQLMLVQPHCMDLLTWVKLRGTGLKSIFFNYFMGKLGIKMIMFCIFRLSWLPFIMCGFALAGIIFTPLYNKWMYNPIIRSIEDTNYGIENIDFPAVTICSNNKVNF